MYFIYLEMKYVYFSAIVLLFMNRVCAATPPGDFIRLTHLLKRNLTHIGGEEPDRDVVQCAHHSSVCMPKSNQDTTRSENTKKSETKRSPFGNLPQSRGNSHNNNNNRTSQGLTNSLPKKKDRQKRWIANVKRRTVHKPDSARDSRDARIDITAQLPDKSGQEADKVVEDRLSNLVQRVLDNLETKQKGEEEEEVEEEESGIPDSSTAFSSRMQGGEFNGEPHEEEKTIEDILAKHHTKPTVKSAFECDEWNEIKSICYFDRNIGDTITFVLRFDDLKGGRVQHVQWKQEYHIRNTNESKEIEINQDNSVWNVVVGSNGQEFRISPITETDFDFNRYTATISLLTGRGMSQNPLIRKISFAVRPVPIDLGFVYPGEQLILNAESFMSLPLESLSFQWFMERDGEKSTLPSNMKLSPTGSCVEISELRKEQEGILVCAVYRVNNIFLTKKRFLIKEITKDILMHGLSRRFAAKRKTKSQIDILRRTARQAEGGEDIENQETEYEDSGVDAGPVEINRIDTSQRVSDNIGMLDINTARRYPITSGKSNLQSNVPPPKQFPEEPTKEIGQPTDIQRNNIEAEVPHGGHRFGPEYIDSMMEGSRHFDHEARTEDKIARLLSECSRNRECSGHASCHQPLPSTTGVCKCHNGYRGNGIFCWEMIVPGRGPSVPPELKKLLRVDKSHIPRD